MAKWDQMVAEWENDATKPNPYVDVEERGTLSTDILSSAFLDSPSEITVKECLKQLAKEEALEAQNGVLHPHEVTASRFLATGLELEEQQ